MSNIRLSNESLLFYKQSKANANKGHNPFVSVLKNDSSDSDNESNSSFSNNIVVTPRLKAHSLKHQSDEKIQGVTPLRSVAVNLGKRLSASVLNNTPSRILQLALQEENEESQDDLIGVNPATAQTSQRQPQTSPKAQQVSRTDKKKAANKAVKSQPKRKVKENPVVENELSDSESRRSQQLENNSEEEILPKVTSKRTTAAASAKTKEKNKNVAINLNPDDSFEPVKIARKSKPPAKGRGKNAENSPIDSAASSKPPAKRKAKNAEEPLIEAADASEPPTTRRGKKSAEVPLTETADAREPVSKRPRIAAKTKAAESIAVSVECADKIKEPSNQVSEMNLREKNVFGNVVGEQVDVLPRRLRGKPAVSSDPNPKKTSPQKSAKHDTEIEKSAPTDMNSNGTTKRSRTRKSVSADAATTTKESVSVSRSPAKSLDNQRKEIPKRAGNVMETISEEAKAPQVDNLLLSLNKTTDKSREKKFLFESSSESEEEKDDDDEEDDYIFPSNNRSRKTKSPVYETRLDIFQTPTKGANKAMKLASHPKSNLKPLDFSPVLLTPSRRRSLSKPLSPDRDEQSNSEEDVADSEGLLGGSSPKKTLVKRSLALKTATPEAVSNTRLKDTEIPQKMGSTHAFHGFTPSTSLHPETGKSSDETPVTTRKSSAGASKTTSPIKSVRSCLSASQKREQRNVPENVAYEDAQQRTPLRLRSGDSTHHQTEFSSAIDPTTLPVPHNQRTRFNLYMTPLHDPVRAVHLLSNEDYCVSWLYLQPTVIFPLKTYSPMMVMLLKGSVEFRSDSHVPSRSLLNSSTRLVQFEAGLFLHVVNTGKEVASFQITEMLR